MLSTIGHIVVRCVWVSNPVVASSRALALAVAWPYCRRWLVVWRSSRSHWEHCAVHSSLWLWWVSKGTDPIKQRPAETRRAHSCPAVAACFSHRPQLPLPDSVFSRAFVLLALQLHTVRQEMSRETQRTNVSWLIPFILSPVLTVFRSFYSKTQSKGKKSLWETSGKISGLRTKTTTATVLILFFLLFCLFCYRGFLFILNSLVL